MAEAVGLHEGDPVKVTVEPGRLIVEPMERRPTLEEMLASYDPKRHGGDAMPFEPVGNEVL
jgi:antitoxin MazE